MLAALDEVAAEHGVEVAAVAVAWLLAKPGVDVADRQRPHARAARRRPPAVDLQLTADQITRLDEASELMDETRQTFLDELYAHGRAHDEQREDRLQRLRNVEPETAELLGVLVRAMNATRVLEIGTSNGYSTIWLGDAAEAVGGTVLSLEIEADRTAQAPRTSPRRASATSSSCARRTPPRRCARSPTAPST